MRTEHLKYFLSLVKTGSITQTAKELYTTHQNVSKIIRQLESDLGTTLFARTTKGVELTATGKLLFPVAQRTFDDFAQLRSDIIKSETRTNISGNLKIFSSDLVSFTMLPSLMQIFASLYPSLHIQLENAESTTILKKLSSQPQSIGVVVILNNPEFHEFYSPYLQFINLTSLIEDSYYCAVSSATALANLKSITLSQFAQYPFAATTLDSKNENVLVKLVANYGGKVSFTSNNISAYIEALFSGRYVGISSNLAHQKNLKNEPRFNQLKLIPFQEDMHISIALATHISPQFNAATKAFVDFIQNSQIYL